MPQSPQGREWAVAVRPARVSNNENGGWQGGSYLNSARCEKKSRAADEKNGHRWSLQLHRARPSPGAARSAPGLLVQHEPHAERKQIIPKITNRAQVLVSAAFFLFPKYVRALYPSGFPRFFPTNSPTSFRPTCSGRVALPPGDPRAFLLLVRSIMAAGSIARSLRRALLFRRAR
jgi:hypothetical protein